MRPGLAVSAALVALPLALLPLAAVALGAVLVVVLQIVGARTGRSDGLEPS